MERFLTQHFLTVFLIIVFSLKLGSLRDFKDVQVRHLWLSVICTALLVIQDMLEASVIFHSGNIFWRVVLSVIGYVLRPMAALGILLIAAKDFPHREMLWIPAWINAAIMSTAFFSDIAFYISEDNRFYRGPLGFTPFVVGFLYVGLVVVFLWRTYRFRFSMESVALYVCALGTILCTLIDYQYEGSRLNCAILISAIFYCMFLRSHDMNRDPMTGLFNRTAFYRDLKELGPRITSMALLGLAGLREINSEKGIQEGDRMLQNVGACMDRFSGRQVMCYRISDGEFLMIFLQSTEREARVCLENALASLNGLGYRLFVGFAARADGETPDELYRRTELAKTADRIAFFRRPGNNRRKSD